MGLNALPLSWAPNAKTRILALFVQTHREASVGPTESEASLGLQVGAVARFPCICLTLLGDTTRYQRIFLLSESSWPRASADLAQHHGLSCCFLASSVRWFRGRYTLPLHIASGWQRGPSVACATSPIGLHGWKHRFAVNWAVSPAFSPSSRRDQKHRFAQSSIWKQSFAILLR